MRWLVGDVQGCLRELELLLETVRFDPSHDELWLLGDLINRGPDSLGVLRLWRDLDGRGVLGNHDVHALLAFSGAKPKKLPTLRALFDAPDAAELLDRLRALPLLAHLPAAGDGQDAWVVHGGLHPAWSDLPAVAAGFDRVPHDDEFLRREDVGFAIGARCCTAEGLRCDFTGRPEDCPAPFRPWDAFYRGDTLVVHGHWAMRGHYRGKRTMGLDSGCVYGGPLTAWCQQEDRVVQVSSPQKG